MSWYTRVGKARQLMPGLASLGRYDVAIVRHANTDRAARDLERRLSELGQRQAAAAAAGYMTRLPSPIAPTAFVSPAIRCVSTARQLLGGAASQLVGLDEIYGGKAPPDACELFRSHEPLASYHGNAEARAVLDAYAQDVLESVARNLGGASGAAGSEPRQTLVLVGHAVYNAATAHALASLRGHPQADQDAVLAAQIGEASGFLVCEQRTEVLEVAL